MLSKEEITHALNDGFYWTEVPFDCERIEITKVRLEAFHGNSDIVHKHFSLIYTLGCKLHGGADDGEKIYITMLPSSSIVRGMALVRSRSLPQCRAKIPIQSLQRR